MLSSFLSSSFSTGARADHLSFFLLLVPHRCLLDSTSPAFRLGPACHLLPAYRTSRIFSSILLIHGMFRSSHSRRSRRTSNSGDELTFRLRFSPSPLKQPSSIDPLVCLLGSSNMLFDTGGSSLASLKLVSSFQKERRR